MKLHYSGRGNFGDDLNPWLWEQLIPGALDGDSTTVFIGIGTILNSRLDARFKDSRFKLVFGSGAGYGPPPRVDDTWKIYCVRGPLTAKRLGMDAGLAVTDAAYLLTRLPRPAVRKRYPVSFMCHHASEPDVDWQDLCDRAGIHNISPTAGMEDVLDQLLASELVLAEAMHGAIVADAFRIPWIPLRCGYRVYDFKWHDWCQSVGLRYGPVDFPPILQRRLDRKEWRGRMIRWGLGMTGIGKAKWRRTPVFISSQRSIDSAAEFLRKLPAASTPVLSADGESARVMSQLDAKLEALRGDLRSGIFKK